MSTAFDILSIGIIIFYIVFTVMGSSVSGKPNKKKNNIRNRRR